MESEGDFLRAVDGANTVETLLPAAWTVVSAEGGSLEDLVTWVSARPAKCLGLEARKGAIKMGCDADLVVFDPETAWTVGGNREDGQGPSSEASPYEGRQLRGVVLKTYVRGRCVFDVDGGHHVEGGVGRLVVS